MDGAWKHHGAACGEHGASYARKSSGGVVVSLVVSSRQRAAWSALPWTRYSTASSHERAGGRQSAQSRRRRLMEGEARESAS